MRLWGEAEDVGRAMIDSGRSAGVLFAAFKGQGLGRVPEGIGRGNCSRAAAGNFIQSVG